MPLASTAEAACRVVALVTTFVLTCGAERSRIFPLLRSTE
jgi:hypothetical protein